MGTPTKTPISVWAAQTLTAGAADTASAVLDFTAARGGTIIATILNGATGPTAPAYLKIYFSCDYNAGSPALLPIVYQIYNSTVADALLVIGPIKIPIDVDAVKVAAGGNTDQNVTISLEISKLEQY